MMKTSKREPSDLDLIKSAKKLDSSSLIELMNRYGKIYDSIVNKFNFSKGYIKQDMMMDKAAFFYEIIKSYDPKKNTKFSTYLYNMTRWRCLDRMKLDGKQIEYNDLSLIPMSVEIPSSSHIIEKIKTFDKRTQYIFSKRFFSGQKKESFTKIGKKLNLTYEGVRQIYIKHLKILKKIHD